MVSGVVSATRGSGGIAVRRVVRRTTKNHVGVLGQNGLRLGEGKSKAG